MSDEGQLIRGNIRHLWEALFSLHLAFAGMSMACIASIAVAAPFSRMECRINAFLHIRQTDFIRGYFATWVPSALAAVLIWVLLRTFARTRFIKEFLRSSAGAVTIFAPPAFWVFFYEQSFWPVGWPSRGAPFELAIALACTLLFLSGKWKAPPWVSFLLLTVHYVFWYFAGSSNPSYPNYAGPFGPTLGFCAAVVWGLYVSRLRDVLTVGPPIVS